MTRNTYVRKRHTCWFTPTAASSSDRISTTSSTRKKRVGPCIEKKESGRTLGNWHYTWYILHIYIPGTALLQPFPTSITVRSLQKASTCKSYVRTRYSTERKKVQFHCTMFISVQHCCTATTGAQNKCPGGRFPISAPRQPSSARTARRKKKETSTKIIAPCNQSYHVERKL